MRLIRNYIAWIVLLACGPIPNAKAIEGLHLSLGTIDSDYFHAQQVRLQLGFRTPTTLSLSVSARHITSPYTAPADTLNITCPDATFIKQQLECPRGRLRLALVDGGVIDTAVSFSYDTGPGSAWHAGIADLRLELSWFRGLFQALLPGEQLKSGRVHARLTLAGVGRMPTALNTAGQMTDVTLDGDNVLEHLDADFRVDASRENEGWSLDSSISLKQGAMYVIPGITVLGDKPGFYIELKNTPVSLDLRGTWFTGRRVFKVENLSYVHPGVLSLQGAASLGQSGLVPGSDYHLKATVEDLARAFPVYLQPLILQTRFSGLKVRGGVTIDLASKADRLEHLGLAFKRVTLEDSADGLKLADLDGNLALGEAQQPIRSTLAWEGMQFHRLPVGAGRIVFEASGANRVRVLEWQDLPILDGMLHISRFEMDGVGTPQFQLNLDAGLSAVSMKAFTSAMGWPAMAGAISGTFSGLRYTAGSLEMNGDIAIQVFNGSVILRDLRVADLFSQFSTLTTDIDINNLDLEQLTDTFEFGRIEGSLNGTVRALRLEDWRPASFDARFETIDDDPRPHRISRKALNNLNELGGGLGGTMSRGFLKIFPSYSYGKLGLRCRLRNNIGELGGIRNTDQGFYLLTRGGLLPPWVEVKAVGRSMPWRDLIDGFKQISSGGIKIE